MFARDEGEEMVVSLQKMRAFIRDRDDVQSVRTRFTHI